MVQWLVILIFKMWFIIAYGILLFCSRQTVLVEGGGSGGGGKGGVTVFMLSVHLSVCLLWFDYLHYMDNFLLSQIMAGTLVFFPSIMEK